MNSIQLKTKSNSHSSFLKNFFKNPTRVIVVSFALVIATGTFLLTLPLASNSGTFTPVFVAFFTATSATCVTGLVVVDTYLHFSVFGQIVILGLIQLGGLGLVTITSFFHLALRKKLGFHSLQLAQESISSNAFSETSQMIKMVMALAFGTELAGAFVLATVFVPDFGVEGIFISVFLAISAYCNAGFDILGRQGAYSSLTQYYDQPVVLITILLLIIFGGLGFIVWFDLFHYRKTKKLLLHTKIVLAGTAILIVSGTVMIAVLEWKNPTTLGPMGFGEKLLNSLFLSVSCRTAGFNSFALEDMNSMTKLVSIVLMFIGAAPGSTGGGIKITSIAVLVSTAVCVLKGRDDTHIMKRQINKQTIYKSWAILFVASLVVMTATCLIGFTTHKNSTSIEEIDALYESVSAFATVGLSVGVTGVANLASGLTLAAMMFLGRVGPVSLALSLSMKQNKNAHQVYPEGRVIVG